VRAYLKSSIQFAGTGEMCEFWHPVPIAELDDLPGPITADDGPLEWKNTENGTVISISPSQTKSHEWNITGQSSVIGRADSLVEAKSKAKQYMERTRRPSEMI